MNKRALLNAVVRNVMTKIAAQQARGAAAPQATPELDPSLGSEANMTARGGIFDLLQDKYGARPSIKHHTGYTSYYSPDKRFFLATDDGRTKGRVYDTDLRKILRRDIANFAGAYMYPLGSRNRKAFDDAATRYGQYRQLQQQNQGTLNKSLQFKDWAREHAPQVHKKLMQAPEENRNDALQILKWQVNNRRNSGNGYV